MKQQHKHLTQKYRGKYQGKKNTAERTESGCFWVSGFGVR